MPSSVASALLLLALALAVAGAGIAAVAILGGVGVVWELFLFYLSGTS